MIVSLCVIIRPYATAERQGYTYLMPGQFESNIQNMKNQVTSRNNAVDDYLN